MTKINIKEKEIIIPKNEDDEEEEEESSEEEEEEKAPEEEPEEEKKGKSGVFVTTNLIDGVLKNCGIRFAVSSCQVVEQEREEEARRRGIREADERGRHGRSSQWRGSGSGRE